MGAEIVGRPVCTIIGGPNGSGKSTIYDTLALPGHFVNADIIARSINPTQPEAASMAAGRRTLGELARMIGTRESFVYETTLSSRQSLEVMRRARSADYEVGLIFVGLNSADLNVKRIANRVARGGHHIPEDIVRRRYESSLRKLPEAMQLADGAALYDNSRSDGPHLLVQLRAGIIEANHLDEADNFHFRLADAVGKALAMSTDAVFQRRPNG